MVRSEQSLSVHEVNIVLVVELVRAADIQHGGVVGGVGGASEFEIFGEGFVHDGVLVRIEPVGEGGAVADSDGVTAGEGHDVGGVQFFGGERVEDFGRGAGWWRKVSQSFVSCRKG